MRSHLWWYLGTQLYALQAIVRNKETYPIYQFDTFLPS